MSAVIHAVNYLANGEFRGEERIKSDVSPAEILYNDQNPGISNIIKGILDEFQEFYDTNTSWKYYKVFMPTEEQCNILASYFKSGRCYFNTASSSTCYPRRFVWEWIVKVDDLNLRTKLGREERDRRTKHIQEEAKILLNRMRNLFTPEFTSLIIAQEREQRLEYDRLIPIGKKNAREVSKEEYNKILKKMDRYQNWFSSDIDNVRIWKTPSDVHHYEAVNKHCVI